MAIHNLSVVIIAWNEEKDLPRVVSSVQTLADEIVVVVDKASTDKTKEVAKKLGCKVFEHKHIGIVEPMREFAIGKTKNTWVLLLDADEELPKNLVDKISQILINPEVDYYRFPRKNIIFGKWIKSTHWWPDYVCRLFKKEAVVWHEAIHSTPMTQGIGLDLDPVEDLAIIHYNYTTISEYLEHLDRYTDHQEAKEHFAWTDLLINPIDEFLRQYFARAGYKDGVHGLALAGLQAFSEFVSGLKSWQKQGFTDEIVDLKAVNEIWKKKAKEYYWWSYEIQANLWSRLKRFFGL